MGVYISDHAVRGRRTSSPMVQFARKVNALFIALGQSCAQLLDYIARLMFSRRAEARLAAIIYALIATVIVAQVVIAFGARVLFWAGAWAASILVAYLAGGLVGLRRGRSEYRPWR